MQKLIMLCGSHIYNVTEIFTFKNMIESWGANNFFVYQGDNSSNNSRYHRVKLFVSMSYNHICKDVVADEVDKLCKKYPNLVIILSSTKMSQFRHLSILNDYLKTICSREYLNELFVGFTDSNAIWQE